MRLKKELSLSSSAFVVVVVWYSTVLLINPFIKKAPAMTSVGLIHSLFFSFLWCHSLWWWLFGEWEKDWSSVMMTTQTFRNIPRSITDHREKKGRKEGIRRRERRRRWWEWWCGIFFFFFPSLYTFLCISLFFLSSLDCFLSSTSLSSSRLIPGLLGLSISSSGFLSFFRCAEAEAAAAAEVKSILVNLLVTPMVLQKKKNQDEEEEADAFFAAEEGKIIKGGSFFWEELFSSFFLSFLLCGLSLSSSPFLVMIHWLRLSAPTILITRNTKSSGYYKSSTLLAKGMSENDPICTNVGFVSTHRQPRAKEREGGGGGRD